MTIKIHSILKDDLSHQDSIDLVASGLVETEGMTISHFAYALKSTEANVPYEIEVIKEHIPTLIDIDFCLVVRKKVNLTAIGINGENRTNIGNDLGRDDYKDSVPSRSLDLPPGFQELYKG